MASLGSLSPTDDIELPPRRVGTNNASGVDDIITREEAPLLPSPTSVSTISQTLEQASRPDKQKCATLPGFNSSPEQTHKTEKQREIEDFIKTRFHKKECALFVPQSDQNLKCHCGEILSMHECMRSSSATMSDNVPPDEEPPAHGQRGERTEWKADNIIRSETNAFGEISFNVDMVGGKKPAKYIRLSDDDSVDDCLELMDKHWKITHPSQPKLVISVVGGAKNYRLDGQMRDTFSHGLIKAAKTTNAWMITSGSNTGVMKAVGQAVHDGQAFLWDNDRMVHLIRCIAIAPWGYTYNRQCLEGKEGQGYMNAYYRTSNQILHGEPVPINPDHTHFIFVDDGYRNRYEGVASFRAEFEKKICTSKAENGYGIPVVMLVLEGGTDAIHEASNSLKEGIPVVVCSGTGRAADLLTYAHSIPHEDGRRTEMKKILQNEVEKAFGSQKKERAMADIDACMEKQNLMIFFDLRRDKDLDVAILSVLTKAEAKNRLKQLELALTWNRADIAQSEIFREDVNWKTEDLHDIMTTALLEDKMDFVRLLLNQGVSMKEYLTVSRLEHLYQDNKIPEHHFLQEILRGHCHKSEFTMDDIKKFLVELLDCYDDDKLEADATEQFQRPYKQLLIWAVLTNRPRLAQFFWEMGEEPITSALACTQLCMGMNEKIPKHESTIKAEFITLKNKFEELATKVLHECHANNPGKAVELMERKSPAWSHLSCLQIAAAANDQEFVSSPACYNFIDSTWKNGILSGLGKILLTSLLPVLSLVGFLDFGSKKLGLLNKIVTFYTSPATTFAYFTISYIIFLGLFSYMLLVDFDKYPSYLEYVLMMWTFSLFVGEVHALFAFPSATIKRNWAHWFTLLNSLELINMVLAFVSFGLRLNAVFFTEAKTIYCINVVIFYISIIQLYIPSSHLGPKMYMIIKMVEQLVMFLVVLVVFLAAYGVASQGLLYHRRAGNWDILRDVIYYPYFSLFGEMFQDEYQTDNACTALLSNGTKLAPYDNTCRTFSWLVYILLGLYLLVVNVLLLNLLIAIFSNVFNTVEKNTIEIWKLQMYFLVMEFKTRVKLAPPLSILGHIFVLLSWVAKKVCRCHSDCIDCDSITRKQHGRPEYLALFEKEMMANYLRRMKSENMESTEEKLAKLQKCVDMLLSRQVEVLHIEDDKQGTIRLNSSTASTLQEIESTTSNLHVPRH